MSSNCWFCCLPFFLSLPISKFQKRSLVASYVFMFYSLLAVFKIFFSVTNPLLYEECDTPQLPKTLSTKYDKYPRAYMCKRFVSYYNSNSRCIFWYMYIANLSTMSVKTRMYTYRSINSSLSSHAVFITQHACQK